MRAKDVCNAGFAHGNPSAAHRLKITIQVDQHLARRMAGLDRLMCSRNLIFAEGEAQRCRYEMYRNAGLLPVPEPRPAPASQICASRSTTDPARLTKARAALERVEQRSGLNSSTATPRTASVKQRTYIVTLLDAARSHVQPGTLNQIGQDIGHCPGLSGVRAADDLPQHLTTTQASRLIERLQRLTASDIAAEPK